MLLKKGATVDITDKVSKRIQYILMFYLLDEIVFDLICFDWIGLDVEFQTITKSYGCCHYSYCDYIIHHMCVACAFVDST